jgi:hypothetical protein
LSERVFKRDQVVAGVIPTGDNCCRFDAEILETVVKELIEEELKNADALMADTREGRSPTFVVATSTSNADGPAVIFRSYGCKGYNANKCKIWQAARCTSAAPSFLKPMFVEIPAPGGWFVDGGLRHNNPSQLALDEAHRLWPTVKRFCLVSIGTGRQVTWSLWISRIQTCRKTTNQGVRFFLDFLGFLGQGLCAALKESQVGQWNWRKLGGHVWRCQLAQNQCIKAFSD